MKKRIVVLSGAGISAESGLKTFRDSGGLWEEYNIVDVATFEGWERNSDLVLDFYNKRRKQLLECEPNIAHKALVDLEKDYLVNIITQNVDDLHERAGSTNILHLHGELKKSRSTVDPNLIYDIKGWELNKGNLCERGSQLRPHIVWFGEAVLAISEAIRLTKLADILIVVGTSLNVYPAAGLIDYARYEIPKYIIDPNDCNLSTLHNISLIKKKATIGLTELCAKLLKSNH